MQLPSRPRILVVALSGIGNWLMQSPTVEALKKQWGEASVTVWVAPRGTKELVAVHSQVDMVYEAPIQSSLLAHARSVLHLARHHFDLGIMFSPGQRWKGATYMFLAGIPVRIGHTYPRGRNPRSSLLLTHSVDEDIHLHDIEQNLRLLTPLGINYPLSPATYKLTIPSESLRRATEVLKRCKFPPTRMIVGFHMGSAPGFEWKRWPPENFIAVGKQLIAQHNAVIALFGDRSEAPLKQRLKQALGDMAVIVNEDLLTVAGIISRCNLFLSNDSGLMHVAAAVGVPTFGLFGPTDEHKTGPRGKNSHVIRADGTSPVYDTERNYFIGRASHSSLQALSWQRVLGNLETVVA